MDFIPINSGITASESNSLKGFVVHPYQFQLATGSGYTPVATQTGFQGSVVYTGYTGSPLAVGVDGTAIAPGVVEYELVVDDKIGGFSFGEIGIVLQIGQLYAIATLNTAFVKVKTVGSILGNRIVIRFRLLAAVPGEAIALDFKSYPASPIPELVRYSLLPTSGTTVSNTFVLDQLTKDTSSGMAWATFGNTAWQFDHYKQLSASYTADSLYGYGKSYGISYGKVQ